MLWTEEHKSCIDTSQLINSATRRQLKLDLNSSTRWATTAQELALERGQRKGCTESSSCTENTGSSTPQDSFHPKTGGNPGKKKTVPEMDSSAVTLGDAKINARRDLHPGQVMITDAISDVRVKYHINPKEIGHGHYGVVRKCMNRETK
eukprot:scaffold929_cov79-Skeletonema_marinoi.AAC.1